MTAQPAPSLIVPFFECACDRLINHLIADINTNIIGIAAALATAASLASLATAANGDVSLPPPFEY